MSAAPLPTTGITGGISDTGVATIEVPMFVDTLGVLDVAGEDVRDARLKIPRELPEPPRRVVNVGLAEPVRSFRNEELLDHLLYRAGHLGADRVVQKELHSLGE